jgi:hypothetical protein
MDKIFYSSKLIFSGPRKKALLQKYRPHILQGQHERLRLQNANQMLSNELFNVLLKISSTVVKLQSTSS